MMKITIMRIMITIFIITTMTMFPYDKTRYHSYFEGREMIKLVIILSVGNSNDYHDYNDNCNGED